MAKSAPKRSTKKNTVSRASQKNLKVYFLLLVLLIAGLLVVWISLNKKEQRVAAAAVSCSRPDFSGVFDTNERTAYIEGKQIQVPDNVVSYLNSKETATVLGESDNGERWVEVDLSDQKLTAWEGDVVFLEAPISSGLRGTPTPTGEFRVWYKTKAQKMSGGEGRSYYYLPNVPFIMFFENDKVPGYKGYSLHGAYWHNDFGNPRSHGCVNLPIPVAERLYYWTNPNLTPGKNITRATADNPGTRIVIHE